MQVDQLAERLQLADPGSGGRLAAVDLTLGVDRPTLRVLVANEVLAD